MAQRYKRYRSVPTSVVNYKEGRDTSHQMICLSKIENISANLKLNSKKMPGTKSGPGPMRRSLFKKKTWAKNLVGLYLLHLNLLPGHLTLIF
jgi:hypothetical protein